MPTLLEIAGIPQPVQVDGVAQKPIEGVSLAYTFDAGAGGFDAVSRHRTQYFEMLGVYGMYSDGWMLSAKPRRPPWDLAGAAIADPATAYELELYELKNDWTQYTDVAAKNPQKVRELRDLMFGEFAKYQVLPLDASAATRFVAPRPSLAAGRTKFEYSGLTVSDIPEGNMPSLLNKSYTITAEVEVPQGGGDGMIYNEGGRFFGYGLYLLKGRPVFTYNNQGLVRTKWQGPALSPGKHTIEFDFKYDGLGAATLAYNNVSGIGRGGTGTLEGRRPGSLDAEDGLQRAADQAAGHGGEHRHRRRHAGGRRRLQGPVQVQRHRSQADDPARPAEADARGRAEAEDGGAEAGGRQVGAAIANTGRSRYSS